MEYVGYTAVTTPYSSKKIPEREKLIIGKSLSSIYDIPRNIVKLLNKTNLENVSSKKKTTSTITAVSTNTTSTLSGYVPQNGDVVEIKNPEHKNGHTATYYNGSWYSDFRLKKMDPYSNGKSTYRIFRNPNVGEALQGAINVATRAKSSSLHICAKAVRTGFNLASPGKYNGEGYNGNNFGDYLTKKGWTQVAKKGGVLFAKLGDSLTSPSEDYYVTYESSDSPTEKNYSDLTSYMNSKMKTYDLPARINYVEDTKELKENKNWEDAFLRELATSYNNESNYIKTTSEYKGSKDFETLYNELVKRNPNAANRRNFFTKLAGMESGYKSGIQNKIGATGYFLFMPKTIKSIAGVSSEEFKNNPSLLMDSALKLYDSFLSSFSEKDKQVAKEKGYSESALVAGAWLGGPSGVKAFLYKNLNRGDGGTTVKKRMDEFNNL